MVDSIAAHGGARNLQMRKGVFGMAGRPRRSEGQPIPRFPPFTGPDLPSAGLPVPGALTAP
jgi:hypothetical protein